VGEQQVLAEAPGAAFGHRVEGHAGQFLVDRQLFGRQRERHQGRLGRHDGEAELFGNLVAQRRGADLGNRQPAGGDHQLAQARRPWLVSRMKRRPGRCRSPDRFELAGHGPAHVAVVAAGAQHVDDVLGRVVAEQLAVLTLVPSDAVAVHHSR
jgi:hypothetical protein